MAFFLLMLLTGTLFMRPGEIFQALQGAEFFFYLFVPCFIVSFNTVAGQLSWRNLKTQPITLCVFLILLADVLSNLVHFNFGGVVDHGVASLKNLMYYLLLVGLVNTPLRLRQLLFLGMVFLPVLYHLGVAQTSRHH